MNHTYYCTAKTITVHRLYLLPTALCSSIRVVKTQEVAENVIFTMSLAYSALYPRPGALN